MRAKGFKVSVSEAEIEEFNRHWPCSELRGLRGVTFEYDSKGLCDIVYRNGDSERWDGPALLALSQDAEKYLGASGPRNL